MITVSATNARNNLYNLIDEVAASGQSIGITKKGETKAVLISQEELESWKATIEVMSDTELMKSIRRGDADIKAGRVRDWEDIKRDLKLDTQVDVPVKIIKSSRESSEEN